MSHKTQLVQSICWEQKLIAFVRCYKLSIPQYFTVCFQSETGRFLLINSCSTACRQYYNEPQKKCHKIFPFIWKNESEAKRMLALYGYLENHLRTCLSLSMGVLPLKSKGLLICFKLGTCLNMLPDQGLSNLFKE